MKITETRAYLNFCYKLGTFSIVILLMGALTVLLQYIYGGVFFPNEYAAYILSSGGFLYSVSLILRSFIPPAPDYDWSLVYPELVGISESDLAVDSRRKNEKLNLEEMRAQLENLKNEIQILKNQSHEQ